MQSYNKYAKDPFMVLNIHHKSLLCCLFFPQTASPSMRSFIFRKESPKGLCWLPNVIEKSRRQGEGISLNFENRRQQCRENMDLYQTWENLCVYICMLSIYIFINICMPKLPSPSPTNSAGLVKTFSLKNKTKTKSNPTNKKKQTKKHTTKPRHATKSTKTTTPLSKFLPAFFCNDN